MKSYRSLIFVMSLFIFFVVGVHADEVEVVSIEDLKLMVQELNLEIEQLTENIERVEKNTRDYKTELEWWKKETISSRIK